MARLCTYLDEADNARFTRNGFSGSIGELGTVDVHFHEKHRTTSGPIPGCNGRVVLRSGEFVGTIAFRGEHGYTRVRASRAQGDILQGPGFHCRPAARRKRSNHTFVQLTATKHARDDRFVTNLVAVGSKKRREPGGT